MYTTTTHTWGNFSGAPGYTKFNFLGDLTATEMNAVLSRVNTFFTALASYLPANVTVTPQALGVHHDDKGLVTGYVTASSPGGAVTGTGTGLYSSAAGACLTWYTDGWSNGRRITGRTFLVPLSPTQTFQNDGTLSSPFMTALNTAAQGLRTGTPALVLFSHRTTKDGTELYAVPNVTSNNVVDRAGVLRSRR